MTNFIELNNHLVCLDNLQWVRLSKSHKLVYFSIPKNGGIEVVFDSLEEAEQAYKQVKEALSKNV